MISLGLLGKDIQHSKSQEVYQNLLSRKINYVLFDISNQKLIPSLVDIFKQVSGLSITAPYKSVFNEIIQLSGEAKKCNAVNCIRRDEAGIFHGYNTDYLAVESLVKHHFNRLSQLDLVIVTGRGAMARVVESILEDEGIAFRSLSRKFIDDLNKFELDHPLPKRIGVINCCSRGFLFKPTFYKDISFFWDMNYGQDDLYFPVYDKFYENGLELLELQAKYALKIWNIK